MAVYCVLQGMEFDPKNPSHQKAIDDFWKKKKWGKLNYVTQLKTLPGQGGGGGRSDIVFRWDGTSAEMGRFAVQRLMMDAKAPRWLDDYLRNNADIVPAKKAKELWKIQNAKESVKKRLKEVL